MVCRTVNIMNENEKIKITKQENVGIVSFQSACISDTESILAAGKQIKDFIVQNKPALIIFDFENVKFFSSQVLGMILETRTRQQEHNGELVISAINPQLYRVFRITNLDKIFRFFPDTDSAITAKKAE